MIHCTCARMHGLSLFPYHFEFGIKSMKHSTIFFTLSLTTVKLQQALHMRKRSWCLRALRAGAGARD